MREYTSKIIEELMSKQQTAVEWLYNQIPLEWTIKGSAKKIFEQAKAMEENQHLQTFKAGQDSMEDGGKNFEQYYNQTYGKE